MFGNQARIPAADVQKPRKYFDRGLCSQLNGLSRDFTAQTLNGVLLLPNGEGSSSGFDSSAASQRTAVFRLHHTHSLPGVGEKFSLSPWHDSLLSVWVREGGMCNRCLFVKQLATAGEAQQGCCGVLCHPVPLHTVPFIYCSCSRGHRD